MYSDQICVRTETDDIIQQWVDQAAQDDLLHRRSSFRYPFFRAAYITQQDQKLQAWCRDISPSGIGLLHAYPLAVGRSTISVCLRNKSVRAIVDVIWNKPAGGGWWLSGGRFRTSSVGYASLMLSTVGDEIERRRHQRYPFFRPVFVSKTANGNRQITECQTFSLNISSGGLGLLADQRLSHGDCCLRTTSGDSSVGVRSQIKSCRELLNGSFQLGVAFKRLEITSLQIHG